VTDHLPEAAKALAIKGEAEGRDLRLDACRGLALWFIFIDHIPDNSFVWLTLRNYGFSDTTEVFVFVSGYTCMLAYGGALRELALQLPFLEASESMGNHDSKIVDAGSVD